VERGIKGVRLTNNLWVNISEAFHDIGVRGRKEI